MYVPIVVEFDSTLSPRQFSKLGVIIECFSELEFVLLVAVPGLRLLFDLRFYSDFGKI